MKGFFPILGAALVAGLGIIVGILVAVSLKVHVVNNIQYQYSYDVLSNALTSFLKQNSEVDGSVVPWREQMVMGILGDEIYADSVNEGVSDLSSKSYLNFRGEHVSMYVFYRSGKGMEISNPFGFEHAAAISSHSLLALPYRKDKPNAVVVSLVKDRA